MPDPHGRWARPSPPRLVGCGPPTPCSRAGWDGRGGHRDGCSVFRPPSRSEAPRSTNRRRGSAETRCRDGSIHLAGGGPDAPNAGCGRERNGEHDRCRPVLLGGHGAGRRGSLRGPVGTALRRPVRPRGVHQLLQRRDDRRRARPGGCDGDPVPRPPRPGPLWAGRDGYVVHLGGRRDPAEHGRRPLPGPGGRGARRTGMLKLPDSWAPTGATPIGTMHDLLAFGPTHLGDGGTCRPNPPRACGRCRTTWERRTCGPWGSAGPSCRSVARRCSRSPARPPEGWRRSPTGPCAGWRSGRGRARTTRGPRCGTVWPRSPGRPPQAAGEARRIPPAGWGRPPDPRWTRTPRLPDFARGGPAKPPGLLAGPVPRKASLGKAARRAPEGTGDGERDGAPAGGTVPFGCAAGRRATGFSPLATWARSRSSTPAGGRCPCAHTARRPTTGHG